MQKDPMKISGQDFFTIRRRSILARNGVQKKRQTIGSDLAAKIYRARILCKPFNEPRNDSQAGRAGTTTLLDVPVRQATLAADIDSLEVIPGLLGRL